MEEVEFKFSDDSTKTAFFCGLDIHKHELAVAIYTKDDSQIEFFKTNIFLTSASGLEQFWNFVKKYRPKGFAMEATGIYHHIVYKLLLKKREEVRWPYAIVVINPADAKGIPGRQKFDKLDAEQLAKYLAMGILHNGKPIVEVLEDLKAIFRMATRLEKDKTALKNRVKKTLDRAGIRPKVLDLNTEWVRALLYWFIDQEISLGECVSEIVSNQELLKCHRHKILKHIKDFVPYFQFSLTPAQRALVRQDLVELDFKTARKSLLAVEIDQLLLERTALKQQAENLASIPGISPFAAVWILAELGPIEQYPTYRHFLAYCGCCPRIVSSAGKVYSAHISRRSNAFLRTIFYNAAVVLCNLVKKESVLKEYANRTVARKSPQAVKLAYCVVAAKLARIAYTVLKHGILFEPSHGIALNPLIVAHGSEFSVFDKKLIRHARNALQRVKEVENIGLLGEYALNLANQFNLAIQGKKLSD